MSLQAIYHAPVIKPGNRLQVLKHKGTLPKTAEVQAIALHAVNRNTVQTNISVRSVCESIHEGLQGEGNFLWKPQDFFTSSKVAKDISGETNVHFFPVPLDMKILGFKLCKLLVLLPPCQGLPEYLTERKTVSFGNRTGMWLPSGHQTWSTR